VLRQKWTEYRLFGEYSIAQSGFFARRHAFTWRCKYQLGQLDNVLAAFGQHQGDDRLYIPRIAHTTGDIDIVNDFGLSVRADGHWRRCAGTGDGQRSVFLV
jgi:hypothetical protein